MNIFLGQGTNGLRLLIFFLRIPRCQQVPDRDPAGFQGRQDYSVIIEYDKEVRNGFVNTKML